MAVGPGPARLTEWRSAQVDRPCGHLQPRKITRVSVKQQNPDGSWSEAEPIPWQGGLHWERYGDRAVLLGPDRDVATVRSRWRWLLLAKMLVVSFRHTGEHRRVRRGA